MFTTRTGQRLSDRNLRRVLDGVTHEHERHDGTIAEAPAGPGLQWVTFHTFRHTHGSMLLDEGWSIPEVSKRLGHASPKITAEVYSHAMRDRSRPLDFLDAVGNGLGNAWATQAPQTAANAAVADSAKSPTSRRNAQ